MNPDLNLESKIEGILFFKNEPIKIKKLAAILKVSEEETREALGNLKQSLEYGGIVVVEHDDEVMLGTAPELSPLIEDLQKEELNKDLSKASLETLSIILYKNGANRAEIDYVRGVNSSFTLRALSVRGLIEKVQDPQDSRRYLYKPTFELLSYLGLQSIEDLPEFDSVNASLKTAAKGLEEQNANGESQGNSN